MNKIVLVHMPYGKLLIKNRQQMRALVNKTCKDCEWLYRCDKDIYSICRENKRLAEKEFA